MNGGTIISKDKIRLYVIFLLVKFFRGSFVPSAKINPLLLIIFGIWLLILAPMIGEILWEWFKIFWKKKLFLMIIIAPNAKVLFFLSLAFRQCQRKIDFYRLPKILVFQLKRFSYGRFKKVKLNNRVNVETTLDLSTVVT